MNSRRKRAGRPQHCRWVRSEPDITIFKPQGKPIKSSERVNITIDEFEAIRLADMEGLYQEQAAAKMNISRQTFGRIITAAHKKIAEALIQGKTIFISGGEIMPIQGSQRMGSGGQCFCPKCDIKIPHRQGVPCQEEKCPNCGGKLIREGFYHHDLIKEKRSKIS